MDDLNQVAIAGRLTKDPQVRVTRNGTAICNLRIACNKMFFNIKVWGDQGREIGETLTKGDIVQVEGRLDWYEWNPGDGPRREYVGVVANDTPGSVRWATPSGRNTTAQSAEPGSLQDAGGPSPVLTMATVVPNAGVSATVRSSEPAAEPTNNVLALDGNAFPAEENAFPVEEETFPMDTQVSAISEITIEDNRFI